MSFADSNRVRVAAMRETTFGVVPATFSPQILRLTGSNFAASKQTAVSNELRSDRMRSSVIEMAATSGGTINFELSLQSFEDLQEAALGGLWTTAINATGVTTAASGNKFTKTGAFNNATIGQWVFVSGFANSANNGWFQITAKTNDDITVSGTLVPSDTGGTVKGKMLRNGTNAYSYSVEQAFLDINQFMLMRGMRVGQLSIDCSAGAIVTGSLAFQGTETTLQGSTYVNGTAAPASTTQVVNATSNVGTIYEDGVTFTSTLQSIRLDVNNALRNQNAVGSKFPKGIGYGSQTVSGSLNAYFEDAVLYSKFLNHEYTSLSFAFNDGGSNNLRFTIPKLVLTTSAPAPGAIDSDVMISADWTAVVDPVTGCQIQIDAA